jgi:molybdopterin molybdotransferase
MRPLAEVQAEILDRVPALPGERVDPVEAIGLALAEPVVAPEDVPAFPNSAMDGYAVRAASLAVVPVELDVIGEAAAGKAADASLTAGTAIKIMTGAPLPAGADAVVPVEVTESGNGVVRILERVASGQNVRPAGGDLDKGAPVFDVGMRIGPAHAGVLASLGVAPLVRRRPVVAMMATGDELVPRSTPALEPGQIRDSNTTLMRGMLEAIGADVVDLGIVGDDPAVFQGALDEAARVGDVIVTSGGVSMGDYDVVKTLLQGRGVDFWRVAIQPGKPLAFGTVTGKPFFGLPGNPVSVFVSFEQHVRPALLEMMGARLLFRDRAPAVTDEPLTVAEDKEVFVRVAIEQDEGGTIHARSSGGQSSNVLSALALADALAVIPVGVETVAVGDAVELEMIHQPEARTRIEALGG